MKKLALSALLAGLAAVTCLAGEVIPVNTANSSLILSTDDDGLLYFSHYGGPVSDPSVFLSSRTYVNLGYGRQYLAYPAAGGRNICGEAICATSGDGGINTELEYVSHEFTDGDDVSETRILLRDPKSGLEVVLSYKAYKAEDVILCHSEIANRGRRKLTLHSYYSNCMHIRAEKYLLSHFSGSWGREMQFESEILTHGTKTIENRLGTRTTHVENPSFILGLDTGSFSEDYGEYIGGALVWSGSYRINFQMDMTGEVDIIGGINPFNADMTLDRGECMTTPDMVYTFSSEGAGKVSRNLHDWARHFNCQAAHMVPTLLNSWEGAYFDIDTKVITDMIDDAHDLGLELFVMDDGWFGSKYPRNDDTQGLGDWMVNSAKLPEGIAYLSEHAHSKGMKFGIWIEPEMVNPRSELYEKHPDWIVAEQGRPFHEIRSQYVLDLSNPAVQDYIVSVFDRIVEEGNVDYVKWDANRHFLNPGSNYLKEQSRIWLEYANGLYKVLERVREKYPQLMIQACASGGGRVEYGALMYFDEVWASDNSEARCRAKIQYGTNMIYPAMAVASHVTAVPNGETANVTPLKFRFDMASTARLGMELQPKHMTREELEYSKKAIASYKEYRDIIEEGDLYRLLSPYETDYYSLMYVSRDKKRAVVFAFSLEYQSQVREPHLRLRGLDPDMSYRIREINPEKPAFWGDGMAFEGDYLRNEGINLNLQKMYSSAVLYLEAE